MKIYRSISAWINSQPKNNEALARKHPKDEVIIRLVAMRTGLCDLIDKEIIDLEFAIELFDIEHQKGIYKRIQEEQDANSELVLTPEKPRSYLPQDKNLTKGRAVHYYLA